TDPAGVSVHVLGDCGGDYLPEQIEEFTHRASNAFLQHFRNAPASVALIGFEWATVQAPSLPHVVKRGETLLSRSSLERQRSDLSSEVSQRIDEIEQKGLREVGTLPLPAPATGEIAAGCVPECAGRIVYARERFRAEDFATGIDAG